MFRSQAMDTFQRPSLSGVRWYLCRHAEHAFRDRCPGHRASDEQRQWLCGCRRWDRAATSWRQTSRAARTERRYRVGRISEARRARPRAALCIARLSDRRGELAVPGLRHARCAEARPAPARCLLFVSPRTVTTHLYRIYPKLGSAPAVSSPRRLQHLIRGIAERLPAPRAKCQRRSGERRRAVMSTLGDPCGG